MHVYIHVPFCARRCSYCDFAIAVRKEVPSDAYVAAVLREWRLWQTEPIWQTSPEIRTLYLGGGTPSRISTDAIGRLLEQIDLDRPLMPGAEVTLEANPDDVTAERSAAWRAAGVNRISLGAQSFDPRVLAWMHRVHTGDQAVRAVETVRAAGITNLSIDLIFGLPRALERDWASDLNQTFALEPEHVSLYGLTVESHTPLGHWAARGEAIPADDQSYASEFLAADQALVSAGYEHYEVSSAARPGRRSQHNSAYWQRAPFIGLGPSAHSGFGRERRWNIRDWAAYERMLAGGSEAVAGRELLDDAAVSLEELYLGLRTTDGIMAEALPPLVHRRWQAEGWASMDGERLRLTAEGWLRLDALVSSVASSERANSRAELTLPG